MGQPAAAGGRQARGVAQMLQRRETDHTKRKYQQAICIQIQWAQSEKKVEELEIEI